MPTATRFSYLKQFPHCLSDQPSQPYSFLGYPCISNLSLSDAMDAFWNLYNITLAVSVNYRFTNSDDVIQSVVISDGQFRLDPPRVVNMAFLGSGWVNHCGMFSASEELPSSASRQPYRRVCHESEIADDGFVVIVDAAAVNGNADTCRIEAYLTADPDNPGMYRVYYNFGLEGTSNHSSEGFFGGYSISTKPASGYNFSGTASFLGSTIPWKAKGTISTPGVTITPISASLSISHQKYTY